MSEEKPKSWFRRIVGQIIGIFAKFLFALGIVLLIALLGYFIHISRKAVEWNRHVHSVLKNADEVRVFSRAVGRSKSKEDGILFETSDKDEVAELLQHIEVKRIHRTCECPGDVSMVFYREGWPVGGVGIHHGQDLRWHEGQFQQMQGALAREDRKFLLNWFSEHGVPDLKEKYEQN